MIIPRLMRGKAMTDDDSNKASFTHSTSSGEFRRVELITGTARRRTWSAREKARVVAESFEPGANISEVARRHGVNRGQLFTWRRQSLASGSVSGDAGNGPSFASVRIATPDTPVALEPASIEIELGCVRIRVRGAVNTATLRAVLLAARSAR